MIMISKFVSLMTALLVLTACKTGDISFVAQPEFQITDYYVQHFVGGVPGVSGDNVVLEIFNDKNFTPDSLYFQQKISKIELRKSSENVLWIGRFEQPLRLDKNADLRQNEVLKTVTPTNFPFDLKDNEAVLLYSKNGQKRYLKLRNLPVKEPLYLP